MAGFALALELSVEALELVVDMVNWKRKESSGQ